VVVEQRTSGDVVLLDLHGKLSAGDGVIKRTIDVLVASGVRRVVLNFADVPYMDSVGLNAIVRAHLTLGRAGGGLALVGVPKHLAHILSVTRLTSVFEVFDSEAIAIEHLRRNPSSQVPS
jgi:anti-sigma B factor antagonist